VLRRHCAAGALPSPEQLERRIRTGRGDVAGRSSPVTAIVARI
jgi:hypothetical protein